MPWLSFHHQDHLDSPRPPSTLNVSTCSNKISKISFGLKVKEHRSGPASESLELDTYPCFPHLWSGIEKLALPQFTGAGMLVKMELMLKMEVVLKMGWCLASIGCLFCANSIIAHFYIISTITLWGRTFVIPPDSRKETEVKRVSLPKSQICQRLDSLQVGFESVCKKCFDKPGKNASEC